MSAEELVEGLVVPGGVSLDKRQRAQYSGLLSLLQADRHAPTAVRAPREAAEVHLADSLVALELGAVRDATRIADLGAGAGFPGLALAIAQPDAEVALVEAQHRKCYFIEGVCSQLQIDNATVVCERAEEWREGLGVNELVVARALAAQPVVLEYAAPLLRVGGSLVDWRGSRDLVEEAASLAAAEQLGLERIEVLAVTPFTGVRDRSLHVYLKVGETPDRFPRRAGVAARRPVGA